MSSHCGVRIRMELFTDDFLPTFNADDMSLYRHIAGATRWRAHRGRCTAPCAALCSSRAPQKSRLHVMLLLALFAHRKLSSTMTLPVSADSIQSTMVLVCSVS